MSSEEEGMSQGFGCPQRSRSKRRGATLGTCRAAFARSQNQEMWVERSLGNGSHREGEIRLQGQK